MNSRAFTRAKLFLSIVVVLVSCIYLLLYISVAIRRMNYPFALEWMEGNSLAGIQRILNGQGIYVEPSLEYIPNVYAPLYWYVSAGVAKLVGASLFSMRLVSFGASLVAMLFVYLIAEKEAASRFAGIIAVGLFAAMFKLSGAWFDIARVDTLFLALLLAGIYLVRYGTSRLSTGLTVLYLVLAYLTKQSTLIAIVPLLLYAVVVNHKRGILLAAMTGAAILLANAVLNQATGDWYGYYVLYLLSTHGLAPEIAILFGVEFIGVWIAGLIILTYVWHQFTLDRPKSYFSLALLIGMVGLSLASRMKQGAYLNVVMPACASIAILFGIAIHAALVHAYENWMHTKQIKHAAAYFVVYLVCLAQFSVLFYDPVKQIPTGQDYTAGLSLLQRLSETKGKIFAPDYLTVFLNGQAAANSIAIDEVMIGGGAPAEKLQSALCEAVRTQRFSVIITDGGFKPPDLDTYYIKTETLFENSSAFITITGAPARPQSIYVPKPGM